MFAAILAYAFLAGQDLTTEELQQELREAEMEREAQLVQYAARFAECVDILSCEIFIVDRFLHLSPDEVQLNHIVEVYRSAGDSGRDQLVQNIASADRSYSVTTALHVALRLDGFNSHHEQQLLTAIEERESANAAPILLARIGSSQTLSTLVAPQINEHGILYHHVNDLDVVAIAGDRAVEPVFQTVVGLLQQGDRPNAERQANLFDNVGRTRYGVETAISLPSLEFLIARAESPNAPLNERLAALFILRSLSRVTAPIEPRIEGLVARSEPEISDFALDILIAARNTTFVSEIANRCEQHPLNGTKYFELTQECPFNYFEALGAAASAAGPRLLEVSYSEHVEFRNRVFLTLGGIGYDAAIPRLRDRLNSEYWSETLAAANALEYLDDEGSRGTIQSIASTHWFPFVREKLAEILEGRENTLSENQFGYFDFAEPEECLQRQWQWDGQITDRPSANLEPEEPPEGDFGRRLVLDINGDRMIGTDRGEWGGELMYQRGAESPETLFEDNVIAMMAYREGALVATGLNHIMVGEGHLFYVWFENGRPQINHITQSAEPAYGGFSQISENVFAAFGSPVRDDYGSRQFVTVFDVDLGVLGLAECVEN